MNNDAKNLKVDPHRTICIMCSPSGFLMESVTVVGKIDPSFKVMKLPCCLYCHQQPEELGRSPPSLC